jgi:transposase
MAKPLGSKNFTTEEGLRLANLAAQGLSKTAVSKALGRSIWTVKRHSLKLGIAFAQREPKPPVAKQAVRPDLAESRARRRQLEDRLIQELALNGWSQGLAAIELDLDLSSLSRHSKRLGITWTRGRNRSVRGTPVSGISELRRLRAQVTRSTRN